MTLEGHQCTTALAWRTGGLSDDTGGTGGYGDWWEDATYGLGRRPDCGLESGLDATYGRSGVQILGGC